MGTISKLIAESKKLENHIFKSLAKMSGSPILSGI